MAREVSNPIRHFRDSDSGDMSECLVFDAILAIFTLLIIRGKRVSSVRAVDIPDRYLLSLPSWIYPASRSMCEHTRRDILSTSRLIDAISVRLVDLTILISLALRLGGRRSLGFHSASLVRTRRLSYSSCISSSEGGRDANCTVDPTNWKGIYVPS